MENHSLYEHFVWMCDDFCGEDDTLCATNAKCDGEDQSLYDNAWLKKDVSYFA
jgi:hypothetical protein